jgi:hypothetical protein
MADLLTKLAYQTMQTGKGLLGLVHKEASTRLMGLVAPDGAPSTVPVPPELFKELKQSMDRLHDLDLEEAERGLYPRAQLFDAPWLDWAARYPLVWLDTPRTWSRRQERNVRDLPRDIETDAFPEYYLQNFHHQTDGYLSDTSASLYDLQVEILFNGTADPILYLDTAEGRRIDQAFAQIHEDATPDGVGRDDFVRAHLTILLTLGRQWVERRAPGATAVVTTESPDDARSAS